MNTIFAKFPLWMVSGLLYGLSWPIFPEINLSFLAWIAFLPLFAFLEKNRNHFWKSMAGSYGAMVIFGCFSAGWLFNFPQATAEIVVIFFMEEFWIFVPFIPFFFLQRHFGFRIALWFFPIIWMVWEWLYLAFEFTMGTHLSAYSQSSNLWMIQYIDITGMWGISLWLMLFNVWLYSILRSRDFNITKPGIISQSSIALLIMIGVPLLYGIYAFSSFNTHSERSIEVGIVPTDFKADYLQHSENGIEIVNQTLHRNDSVAFANQDIDKHIDLYVWPETGTIHLLDYSNLGPLLYEAVHDWESALVLGCKSKPTDYSKTDSRIHTSGVLISSQDSQPAYHHKTIMTPGQEAIPYHAMLSQIPGFPIPETDSRFLKKGKESIPLDLNTKNGDNFKLGVSLCFEQWYPHHWTSLAANGADFIVHLAAEGWYGEIGFQQFMANVTRLRCIETRRQAARSANVGLSLFIDHMGRFFPHKAKRGNEFISSSLYEINSVTWYSRHPNWLPSLGIVYLFSGIVFLFKIKSVSFEL